MKINSLFLWKFRNFSEWRVKFTSSVVVLVGKNGVGKTNLLEAVSLLIPGRGMRQASAREIGWHGAEDWAVSAQMDLDGSILDYGTGLKLGKDGNARRVYMCQDQLIHNKNKWDYAFPLVWITPQMDHLFSASASGRRAFLDRLVAAVYPWYGREVSLYGRAMKQRNKLLQTRPNEDTWLTSLEKAMSKHAVAIVAARREVIEWLNIFGQKSQKFPVVTIQLICSISTMLMEKSALDVEEWLCQQLHQVRIADRYRGRSSFGAHKSDFELFYSQEKLPASRASTGQQKVCLVGLLLAHAQLIEHTRQVAPILLLDEPLVHLDENHRASLMSYMREAKSMVFLTGTDQKLFHALDDCAQVINMKASS